MPTPRRRLLGNERGGLTQNPRLSRAPRFPNPRSTAEANGAADGGNVLAGIFGALISVYVVFVGL